ncbi:MAG: excinuclease ABC subunit UvrC, partial [bacterium]|nr:excinuclease ABC subunit UvrC [bacterium]
MADPASYRPRNVPTSPGVYRFRDPAGRVLYVGKARNLRARLANYFQPVSRLHPRTASMVTTASSVQWTTVETEAEALTLEYTWIKEFAPRFNVVFRDDKSYPYLAVTMAEEVPRVFVTRGTHTRGNRYFGPYPNVGALRETLDLLLRVFPVRSCSTGVYRRAANSGRPCLLGYIDKCAAPCVGRVSAAEHRELAQRLCDFMAGNSAPVIRRLTAEMREAAASQDYETAARRRDDLNALERVLQRNVVVLPPGTDADIFALVTDELQASVQVFYVRDGRVRGQRGWITDRADDAPPAELVERLLSQAYGPAAEGTDTELGVPREILVPVLPADAPTMREWLRTIRGSHVDLRVPQRGDKRALMETVEANAKEALASEKLRRGSDLASRSRAIEELQRDLGLPEPPLRIECYDISHTQGTYQVGSMVVFEDAIPRKRDYRTFNVRGEDGAGARDDTAALAEVLRRRFSRRIDDDGASSAPEEPPGAGENAGVSGGGSPTPSESESGEVSASSPEVRAFAYEPGLLVIDGGAPQVEAAAAVLAELGENVPVVSLAKRLEEVWFPGDPFPVVLPRGSEGLYLLQRVRDEAHRFAVSRHRARRTKGMTTSALDGIPGVGPARAKALLKRFGSVKRIRAAHLEEVAEVRGIGPALAGAILTALGAPPTAPDAEGGGAVVGNGTPPAPDGERGG